MSDHTRETFAYHLAEQERTRGYRIPARVTQYMLGAYDKLKNENAALLSERTAQEAEIARLTKERDHWRECFTMLEKDIVGESGLPAITAETVVRLSVRVAKLEKGLGFYADPKNWIDTPPWDGDPESFTPKAIPVLDEEGGPCDCGDTARAALTPAKENTDDE